MEDVRKSESFVYCVGEILFTDVFEQKWALRFSRRWQIIWDQSHTACGGRWINYGSPEVNGEYKVN